MKLPRHFQILLLLVVLAGAVLATWLVLSYGNPDPQEAVADVATLTDAAGKPADPYCVWLMGEYYPDEAPLDDFASCAERLNADGMTRVGDIDMDDHSSSRSAVYERLTGTRIQSEPFSYEVIGAEGDTIFVGARAGDGPDHIQLIFATEYKAPGIYQRIWSHGRLGDEQPSSSAFMAGGAVIVSKPYSGPDDVFLNRPEYNPNDFQTAFDFIYVNDGFAYAILNPEFDDEPGTSSDTLHPQKECILHVFDTVSKYSKRFDPTGAHEFNEKVRKECGVIEDVLDIRKVGQRIIATDAYQDA